LIFKSFLKKNSVMKKVIVVLLVALFSANYTTLQAQEDAGVLNGIYQKMHVPNRVPVPFDFLREADVMWSKLVWRRIDLREKINLPLYYPEGIEVIDDRMSLINLLLYGIENEGLKAYNPDDLNNEFKYVMTYAEVKDRMGGGNDTLTMEDPDTGEMITKVFEGSINPSDVKLYRMKELWFFDRERSLLEVRMIGMCPIREYYKQDDVDQEDKKYKQLFWVYYPDLRPLFARTEVFNSGNDAERRTFDDIFVKRMFSSYIEKVSNVYGNRSIGDYAIGLEAMLESERIKTEIFDIEQDMWEY